MTKENLDKDTKTLRDANDDDNIGLPDNICSDIILETLRDKLEANRGECLFRLGDSG